MNAAPPTAGPRSRLTGRTQFVLLALLFFAPFVAAWGLYFYFPDARPTGTTNYGQLVNPPLPLPNWSLMEPDGSASTTEALRGKWLLIQLVDGSCDRLCTDRLVTTRQMRTALAAERERLLRVVIGNDAAGLAALQARLAAEQPDVSWHAIADLAEARRFFGSSDAEALFLVDPVGNYLMLYPGGHGVQADFKGMQKDINKLLKLSRLG